MSKQEHIRILVLLSQMEGFMLGKLGMNELPSKMDEELIDICELLTTKIRDESTIQAEAELDFRYEQALALKNSQHQKENKC